MQHDKSYEHVNKKKEKRSKKERKNYNSKDKILGVKNPLRSKYFVFATREEESNFLSTFFRTGHDKLETRNLRSVT